MRKVILMLLLAAVISSAIAEEWVAVSYTDDGGVTVYADPSTLRKEGNIVSLWTLGDFKKAEQIGNSKHVMSLKEQYEYDCKEQQMRRIHAAKYSENMGRGKEIDSSPIHEGWQEVPPSSLNEQMWRFACGKM